jgi:nuclear pore complex protein Nup54
MTVVALTDNTKVFGDERDAVLIRWNQLQAFWGSGKGYHTTNNPPVIFTPTSHFARFKALVYFRMPDARDEDGLIGLTLDKPFAEVE